MCPPPVAPKPQLQHPLAPPNTCLPLVCLKPQTQKFVMAVHIPWYSFVGDSSGTIVITHFFQGKLLSVGKANVTNYRLLQNKALGSVKICEELQGSLAGVPQPLPGCLIELCWLGKVTFMACLSLCEQYFAIPWQNTAWWGSTLVPVVVEYQKTAVFIVSEVLQWGNAVIQGLCSVIASGGCWKTAGEAQGHENCWYLIDGSERGLVSSKSSSGRGWWGSGKLCSSRGTTLPRGFPSTENIRVTAWVGIKEDHNHTDLFFFSCKPLPPV